jgi:hypothetical protein
MNILIPEQLPWTYLSVLTIIMLIYEYYRFLIFIEESKRSAHKIALRIEICQQSLSHMQLLLEAERGFRLGMTTRSCICDGDTALARKEHSAKTSKLSPPRRNRRKEKIESSNQGAELSTVSVCNTSTKPTIPKAEGNRHCSKWIRGRLGDHFRHASYCS